VNDNVLTTLRGVLESPALAGTELADGTSVLLDIGAGRVVSLSESATFISQQVREGARSFQELAETLAAHYGLDERVALADAEVFVEELLRVLTQEDDRPNPLESR
jgi:hypothetical protein